MGLSCCRRRGPGACSGAVGAGCTGTERVIQPGTDSRRAAWARRGVKLSRCRGGAGALHQPWVFCNCQLQPGARAAPWRRCCTSACRRKRLHLHPRAVSSGRGVTSRVSRGAARPLCSQSENRIRYPANQTMSRGAAERRLPIRRGPFHPSSRLTTEKFGPCSGVQDLAHAASGPRASSAHVPAPGPRPMPGPRGRQVGAQRFMWLHARVRAGLRPGSEAMPVRVCHKTTM